ncbi:MAG: DUF2284 domain-containing protein [Christensenellales bacterium]|jgi:predicted metal-binding protein
MIIKTREALEHLLDDAQLGIWQYGFVRTDAIEFLDEVRGYCEQNRCRRYGVTWACPPAIGTIDECRDRCRQFDEMLVFTGKYDLEDSFDIESMEAGLRDFKDVCDRLAAQVKPHIGAHMILSNEGCLRCETCTYPDAPCRFPDSLQPSLEGYGIMVSDLAAMAGVRYINGKDTVTYFGGLLFHDQMPECFSASSA